MREIECLKEEILRSYPRLSERSSFGFACHPGVTCFNDCCGDVSIFLTPYDILRLKNGLGISSGEFLSEYAVRADDESSGYPVILLKMHEDERRSCPFVGGDGCRVYPDRPWSCRMYPLGRVSPAPGGDAPTEEFYFMLEDPGCRGLEEPRTQTIEEWLDDQGIREYLQMGEPFRELTLHEFFREGRRLTPKGARMFSLACYDLDRFRDFVFRSSFLDRFDIDAATLTAIERDDLELLKLGHDWLRWALFGEKTLEIRPDAPEAGDSELENPRSVRPRA